MLTDVAAVRFSHRNRWMFGKRKMGKPVGGKSLRINMICRQDHPSYWLAVIGGGQIPRGTYRLANSRRRFTPKQVMIRPFLTANDKSVGS
jgi:hypothetical protein